MSLFAPLFSSVVLRYKKFVAIQIVISLLWSIDFIARPYLIKLMIDSALTASSSNTNYVILYPAFMYLLISIFTFLSFRLFEYVVLLFKPDLTKSIGISLLQKIFCKPSLFFQNQFAGALANKVNDVTVGIYSIINIIVECIFGMIAALSVSVYALYRLHPNLALILTLWISLFLSVSIKFSAKASFFSKSVAKSHSTIIGRMVDVLSNITNVRLFSAQKHEINNLESLYNNFILHYRKRDWFFMKMYSFQELSFVFYQILCFLLLLQELKSKTISHGDFAMVMILNISILSILHSLSKKISDLSENYGKVMQGLQVILDTTSFKQNFIIEEIKSDIPQEVFLGSVVFSEIDFTYPSSNKLFNNLSLTIPPKQRIGIVGYSGSGKTTIINLLLRLYNVDCGNIFIDNQNINLISEELLRKNIAVIPQDITLFNRSLIENIRYGKLDASDEEVLLASQKAKADQFISRLPDGYNAVVGERGVKLSGGERQRIAIARAILKNAPILILDEATNQLDSNTESEIQESIHYVMQNKTTIVIAHRLSTLVCLDRILVLDKGKIIQDGTHKELINAKGLYKELWDSQCYGVLPLRGNISSKN